MSGFRQPLSWYVCVGEANRQGCTATVQRAGVCVCSRCLVVRQACCVRVSVISSRCSLVRLSFAGIRDDSNDEGRAAQELTIRQLGVLGSRLKTLRCPGKQGAGSQLAGHSNNGWSVTSEPPMLGRVPVSRVLARSLRCFLCRSHIWRGTAQELVAPGVRSMSMSSHKIRRSSSHWGGDQCQCRPPNSSHR